MTDYLIEGIRILNTNPPEHPGSIFIYMIGFISIAFIFIGLYIWTSDMCSDIRLNIILSVIFALIVGSVLGGVVWYKKNKDSLPKTYDVFIDESVSFRDFDEKYEVVERNGEIYTIKARDSDE